MALATSKAPASPFAELLRRSKFATYDPAIRQTYKSAPANSHRGDWGVKRPISLRRKNAFISLTSFEHHAHFTEWNNAENQVRFIRRIEEMGGVAKTTSSSTWYQSLGAAKTTLPFDSDFCPEEGPYIRFKPTQEVAPPPTVNLDTLGKRGPRAYGSQRQAAPKEGNPDPQQVSTNPVKDELFLAENIHAMTPRQFKRYLRSLRAQRPEFQRYVHEENAIKEKNLFLLGKKDDPLPYRKFLQAQMTKGYDDYNSHRIAPQPHPNAALLYTNPTPAEQLIWTKPKPGFYLNNKREYSAEETAGDSEKQKENIVSFGGLTTAVEATHVTGKKMLLDRNSPEGVSQAHIEDSILQLRLHPKNPLIIDTPPATVGNRPQGLKAIRFGAINVIKDDKRIGWSNPHPFGIGEYVAMDKGDLKVAPQPFRRSRPAINGSSTVGGNSEQILSTLSGLLVRPKPGDHDL
ncbi:hypothetical protein H0H93_001939 [Arthromyces matolae]|nr:hypothetical protein H0H93_001939 [Arthromyces matolae]